ncbi:MAG: 4-(cytidine 5'-diphospho)-2-C-methyl-D-erythritol kinase [Elusimicrobia bacterium RBG_16_66_12]|nr:MAG: 4-(cytidine 5'-diphospho)-2-C-methyl-D-erythritol kinase [Elusimicrobia bacterium RBG_16_66_12]
MKVQCPAKVNLFLEVTGRRKDGYHTLSTLFVRINIYDVLELVFAGGSKPTLEIVDELHAAPLSAGPDNLVMRAAEAFYRAFRVGVGVKMTLTKRIPMGAGLGGGSSDAAGTLLGLAKLFQIDLTAARRKRLHAIAAKLGADVPFFLKDVNYCLATGIGDRLKTLKIHKSLPYMVLVWPGFPSPTANVYQALPPRRRSEILTRLSQLDRLVRSLKRGRSVEEWGGFLFNRLEQAELPVLTDVAQARRILAAAGAKGVRMSGSGSSVFGFVSSHAEGEKVVRRLQAYPWKVYLTSCHG